MSVHKQIEDHLATAATLHASANTLEQCADLVIGALRSGGRVYVAGNGGSAADAQHIAAELVGRFKHDDKPALPAMALTTDTSNLTAIANDFGYDRVFARQVEAFVQAGDIVWLLSVSGNSANILAAASAARDRGARIIGFTGRCGTMLSELSDLSLMVAHKDSDRVQEIHQLAYHIVCSLVEEAFRPVAQADEKEHAS
jgi:D-sedoheptulose 7-phosphate isomerase